MVSLYLQYERLPQWLLTYFYYFQYRIASFFHISEVGTCHRANCVATSIWNNVDDYPLNRLPHSCRTHISYNIIALFNSIVRVFWKTRSRRARTIHGDSILLLGPCDSGKTSLFYMVLVTQCIDFVGNGERFSRDGNLYEGEHCVFCLPFRRREEHRRGGEEGERQDYRLPWPSFPSRVLAIVCTNRIASWKSTFPRRQPLCL